MESKTVSILEYLFVFAALTSILASFSVYHFSGLGTITLLSLILSFIVCKRSVIMAANKKEVVIFLSGWIIVYLIGIVFNFSLPSILALRNLIVGCLFLCLNREIQKKIISKFLWALAIILLLSIIEYLIFQFFGKGIIIGRVTRVTDYRETNFYNLIFNIVRSNRLLPRFQSLANEPGLLGTLCGFLIFFTWKVKSMRFPFFVFIISGILSFSLAYYIFLAIFLFVNFRFKARNIFIMLCLSFVLYQSMKDYVENLLLSRVADAEDVEDLDNRTSDTFNLYFNRAFEKGQLWFGVGVGNMPKQINNDGGNAGAKKWIYQYGIISFIVIFFTYNNLYRKRKCTRLNYYDIIFLAVFWLSFYQRASLTALYMLLVFLAMPRLNDFEMVNIKKNENNTSD